MDIRFSPKAWAQYQYWQETDPAVLAKLNGLIRECRRTPFAGTGKPEPLKGDLRGYWSRRITGEHRLVYRAEGSMLYIVQCRFHY